MSEILTIKSIGPKGDGIAEFNGQPVYIARTSKGDQVNVEIKETNDGVLRGKVVEYISHGADRVLPPCVYYDSCGGCQVQHISDEQYKIWKIESVQAALTRVQIAPEMMGEPVFISNATRRRATLAAFKEGKNVTLGFHQSKSHDVQPIEKCLLLTPSLNGLVENIKPYLARFLKEQTPTDIMIQDIDNAIEMIIVGPLSRSGEADTNQRKIIAEMCETLNIARVGWQKKEYAPIEPVISITPVSKKYGDMIVDISMGSFLQPSSEGEAALVSLVVDAMPKIKKMKIADLFSGCGTFTGPALKFGHVHAVEENAAATEALQTGMKRVQGLTVEKRNLAAEPLTLRELKNYNVVIFDPPRAGAKEQCEKLAKSTVKTVIAVSCNPSTFARDAKILIDGGYRFKKMTMVDQFIWSSHTEVVGIFERP